jgi:gamma-glutamyltranspeptidase/glutathione hydrolase
MGSMMAPTLVERGNGAWVVTGSSGSNRIRSAILQVLVNLIDFGLPVAEAVAAPRLHYEGDLLNLEPPVDPRVLARLQTRWPKLRLWSAPSVFFGGAHSVTLESDGALDGGADPRRGGVVRRV